MAVSNLGTLVNNKLKYFAAGIIDTMPYIRQSKPYFKDDVANKKAGKVYKFYVTDPGVARAGTDNLDITNDQKEVWELPVEVVLLDGVTSVALDAWHKLTAVEDFVRDIVEPHARGLGAELEQKIIEDNWFRADSAIVDNSGTFSSKAFSLLASRLRGIRSAGRKVGFAHPDVFANLSDNLLGKFIPSDIMKKIYGESVVSAAFGSSWIEENYMPFITANSSAVSGIAVNLTTGEVTGTNIFDGMPFTLADDNGDLVKTVDLVGKKTNENYVFIAHKGNAAYGEDPTKFYIQLKGEQIRFMNEKVGADVVVQSNPTIGANRYSDAGVDLFQSPTGTSLLTAGETYAVVQVRDADALEFDTYEFSEVAGAKNEKVKAMELTVQSVEQGSVMTRNSIMRIDVPYMAKLVLTKLARVAFIKVPANGNVIS